MKDKVGAEYQAMQASSVPDCQGEGPVPFSDGTVKRSKAQTLEINRGNLYVVRGPGKGLSCKRALFFESGT